MRERAVLACDRQVLWLLSWVFPVVLAPRGASGQDAMDGGRAATTDAGAEDDASVASEPASCRCEQRRSAVDRLLHTCTGATTASACASLCAQGGRKDVACDRAEPVRACCDMGEFYAYLYWDCSHPNCKQGFYTQCRAYGGLLVGLGDPIPPDSPCAFTVTDGVSNDGLEVFPPSQANKASCAVRGANHGERCAPWLWGLGAILVVRRARKFQLRRRRCSPM